MSVVANVAINVDSRGATQKLREVQAQSQATERAFDNLGATVGKLAAALGTIQAAKFVFAKTAELESQTRSLQVLTGSAEKAGQIIKDLQQLGAVTPFTSTELIDSAKRLQAFGVETDKVVETTRRLADVSGATGAELQGLVTAYGQVQAKGRLQGEELLQFQERGVALQQELRKQYGLSGEEFQDALSKGKISAEAVEFAIQNLTNAGGKYADGAIAQSDTLSGRLSTLQDGIESLARRIGEVLTPALKAIFNQAIAVVDAINSALAAGRGGGFTRSVAGARQFLNIGATSQAVQNIEKGISQVSSQKNKTGIQQNLQALQQYQRLLQSVGPNDPNADRAVKLQGVILDKINENIAAQNQLKTAGQQTQKLFTPPPLGGGTSGQGRKGKSDADKAAREAEKLAKELERSLEAGDRLGTQFSRQILLLDEASETERKRLKIQFDFEDRARQITELKNVEQQTNLTDLNNEIRKLEILKLQREELKGQIEQYYKRAGLTAGEMLPGGAGAFRTDVDLGPQNKVATFIENAQQQLQDLETRAISVAQGIGDALANSLVNGIQGLIAGTENAKQVFANFLQSIGQVLAQEGTKMIASYIAIGIARMFAGLGSTGMFKGAGPVQMPGGGGFAEGFSLPSLLPGRANGGPVTGGAPYLVGERGPELFVPGTGGSVVPTNDLRAAMGSAPGSSGGPVLNMSFETTNIGGVEYVSRDQLEAAMAATRRQAANDGAKRGMSMTLDRIQQSPQTRNRLGMR